MYVYEFDLFSFFEKKEKALSLINISIKLIFKAM